jgi:two-component system chemotaxis response regulator CheY
MAFQKGTPVLIVDDYNTMLRLIRNLLQQIGIDNVDDATNGEDALAKLNTGRYGLCISDWNMPNMSGLELLKNVRANEKIRNLPFILVTAESKTENVIAASKAGVSNYIVKPFNAETLRTKIDKVFATA